MSINIDKASIQDLEKHVHRVSPKSDEKTVKAVLIENDENQPIPVYQTDGPVQTDVATFDEALSVAKETETLVVQYTVPPSKLFQLDRITCGGDNIAKYRIEIDGNTNKVARTYEGSYLFAELNYSGFDIGAGLAVKVFAEHCNDDSTGDFEATIEGRLKDE